MSHQPSSCPISRYSVQAAVSKQRQSPVSPPATPLCPTRHAVTRRHIMLSPHASRPPPTLPTHIARHTDRCHVARHATPPALHQPSAVSRVISPQPHAARHTHRPSPRCSPHHTTMHQPFSSLFERPAPRNRLPTLLILHGATLARCSACDLWSGPAPPSLPFARLLRGGGTA